MGWSGEFIKINFTELPKLINRYKKYLDSNNDKEAKNELETLEDILNKRHIKTDSHVVNLKSAVHRFQVNKTWAVPRFSGMVNLIYNYLPSFSKKINPKLYELWKKLVLTRKDKVKIKTDVGEFIIDLKNLGADFEYLGFLDSEESQRLSEILHDMLNNKEVIENFILKSSDPKEEKKGAIEIIQKKKFFEAISKILNSSDKNSLVLFYSDRAFAPSLGFR